MKIDCHVHLFCLTEESGGNTRLGWLRDVSRPFVARALKVHKAKDASQQEALYVERLAKQVRSSELDRAVLLSFDQVYRKDGTLDDKRSGFHVPNRYTQKMVSIYPDAFLFGASVHPYRKDAVDALHRAKEAGAVLVKLLPNSHNFDPADPQLRRYFETLRDLALPLLLHGGYEHTIPASNQSFGDPARFAFPLSLGTTVIVAHGGSAGRLHLKETFGAFLSLLDTYPNCYGDTAAFANFWRCQYLYQLKNPELLERKYGVRIARPFDRFIHGSDFPIPISPRFFGSKIAKAVKTDPAARDNHLQADVTLKRLAGVPDDCLTRASDALGFKASM
jgi:uncharacterized protein